LKRFKKVKGSNFMELKNCTKKLISLIFAASLATITLPSLRAAGVREALVWFQDDAGVHSYFYVLLPEAHPSHTSVVEINCENTRVPVGGVDKPFIDGRAVNGSAPCVFSDITCLKSRYSSTCRCISSMNGPLILFFHVISAPNPMANELTVKVSTYYAKPQADGTLDFVSGCVTKTKCYPHGPCDMYHGGGFTTVPSLTLGSQMWEARALVIKQAAASREAMHHEDAA
jgi:hypothetical protein